MTAIVAMAGGVVVVLLALIILICAAILGLLIAVHRKVRAPAILGAIRSQQAVAALGSPGGAAGRKVLSSWDAATLLRWQQGLAELERDGEGASPRATSYRRKIAALLADG